ncbi:hypothetical protein QZH41_004655 [Actinostola sp. cb2023]|nr:hypothetical protein QZH41_004655 [Actinostola sp. cb2023]
MKSAMESSNIDEKQTLQRFIDVIKDVQRTAAEFMKSPLDVPQSRNDLEMLRQAISAEPNNIDGLMRSYTLRENNNRRVAKVFSKIVENVGPFLSINPGTAPSHTIPFFNICQAVGTISYSESLDDLNEISITKVCNDIQTCPAETETPLYANKMPAGSRRSDTGGIIETASAVVKKRENMKDKGEDIKMLIKTAKDLELLILKVMEEQKRKRAFQKRQRELAIKKWKYFEETISVCTVDNKCDVKKALPMMTGIFWYQINEMIFQRLCPQNCQSEECDYLGTFHKVLEDADRLISYAASLPSYWGMTWNNFYNDAVSGYAFTQLDVALSMVEEKKEALEISQKQCDLIKFVAACPHDNFYQQYKLIKKIQRNQNKDIKVKDLRESSQIDYEQLVTLQKQNLQHFELFGRINKLDENLQASVSGISTYFEGLAKFDQGIASADAAFLKDSLDKYTTTLAKVETKLTKDIKEAMTLMEVILAANLAEEAAKLAALILTNSNPLKLIFAGPDVMDVLDQSGKVANAAAELAHGIALFVALDDLTKDSLQLRRAFGSNAEQISTLQSVVDKIKNGQENEIRQDSDKFIEEYGAYTPKADRSILAKNDALWSAFKDATCDVLNGDVGIAGSIPKGIAGGKLLCERLEGTLAQFFTLREDIFDFQFQLVDSVAAVVRGNLAQRFARNIEGKHDVIEASQLMTGFFMMQSKIQKVASVYCNVLEYKNLGKRVQPCSTVNGLFGKENIDALISYKDNTPYDQIERDVYIPTRAQSEGDTGVVDLQALGRGETVIFQIPVDENWLTEYGWIIPGQRSIPFIKSLKLILPHKTYEDSSAQRHTTTQFQLVDAVAAVIRGNLAQRFARNIEGKHDVLEASQFMTGFFMMQSKIQKVSSVYCDVLEYKNVGKRVKACSTINGLFGKENIDALISYQDNTPFDEIERDVYIPTRAQSEGDTGVVDLQALGRGETVIFQIPVDNNWLTEYGWILPGQRSIPFIKSLKLFLPHKTYEDSSAQGYSTTQKCELNWTRFGSHFGGKGKFDPAQRLKPGQVPGIDCGKFGCCDDYSKADFTGQVGCAMKLCVDNFIETCNDIYRMPRHQKEAECSNSFTRKNCPYTCNACTCKDRYARVCQMFKDVSRGCESNSWRLRNFMGKYCPRTCGRCPEV